MNYHNIVRKIKSLKWENLTGEELQTLMILSAFSAIEFAASLRIVLIQHPTSKAFIEMSEGELGTNNLTYGEYQRKGDHAEFLWFFIEKYSLMEKISPEIALAGTTYFAKVSGMSDELRVMSIISREQELSGIFQRILEAKDWTLPGLPEFRYYLEEHIKIDSQEGGHADMLKGFEVNDSVAPFYQTRLEMYYCMKSLM